MGSGWCFVLCAWCLVLGAWCLVLGAWCLVPPVAGNTGSVCPFEKAGEHPPL